MEPLLLLIGIVIGAMLTKAVFKPKSAGTLRAYDAEDGDGPYFFLDLDLSPDVITHSEYVTFKVSRK